MFRTRGIECLLIVAALAISGCTGSNSEYTEVDPSEPEVGHGDHGHGGHDHGSHGPNGGDIVELGTEDMHAELVVDEEAHRINVHILGGDIKAAKPIEAAEISLSFKHGDEVEEFKLAAAPKDGEPEGQSSLFTLKSDEAFEELHEHPEGATISITVGEETFTGIATHDHDHAHGHDHGDDDHGHGDEGHDHGDGDKDHDDEADHKEGDDKSAEDHNHKDGDDDEHKDEDNAKSDSDKDAQAEPAPKKDAE